MAAEIPVYLFTGFLEAGKTKFIQETLEDPRLTVIKKRHCCCCARKGRRSMTPPAFTTAKMSLLKPLMTRNS